MRLLFLVLFVTGALLAGTADLQLTAGAILMLIGYAEFRKLGFVLDEVDDFLLDHLRK